jgi:hypothetical protein
MEHKHVSPLYSKYAKILQRPIGACFVVAGQLGPQVLVIAGQSGRSGANTMTMFRQFVLNNVPSSIREWRSLAKLAAKSAIGEFFVMHVDVVVARILHEIVEQRLVRARTAFPLAVRCALEGHFGAT